MKLIHLSDLHLGKRINAFSMIEDQRDILTKIIGIIDNERPDAVLIAGDVYDKSVPSADAVELFDDFLVRLAKRNLQIFVISGNHDSPERIAFGRRLMDRSGVHMSPVYNGQVLPVSLEDTNGTINIYMLPFLKPAHVRRYFPDIKIDTYTDALRVAVTKMNLNPAERNILVTHQFVTGAIRSDSEEISVGGSDHVDASVFADFDYVALGHLHRPQNCTSDRIRYCGTPLKYSFSEVGDQKSVTIIELLRKGTQFIRTVELVPKHDMKEIRGSYKELTLKKFYENSTYQEDYMHITLTDEEDIPYAIGKLRSIYHNLMKLDYDNKRTRSNPEISVNANAERESPMNLFSDFYKKQNNQAMSEEQSSFMRALFERVWGENE
ncbi:MAG: exonuclease SbcCD subunit D [Clostridiales bacterium]|nr:exonuclease SbcCD subunit D [Clostridiales bacterium]